MKKFFAVIAMLLFTLGIYACDMKMPELSLNVSETTLKVGETYQIPLSAKNVVNPTYTYDDFDQNVVKVENGLITALQKGTTDIKIGIKNTKVKAVYFHVEVTDNRQIEIVSSQETLCVGEEISLSVKPNDIFINDDTLHWSSSNNSVATIDADGRVKALKKGTVTFTVKVDGLTADITFTVKDNRKVTINAKETELLINEVMNLEVTSDDINLESEKYTLIWKSSNELLATVEGGKVTGKGAGTVTITVSVYESKELITTASITLVIIDNRKLELKATTTTIFVGASLTLDVLSENFDIAGKSILWTSSDSSIATVEAGVVKAKKPGTVTIYAKIDDVTASIEIIVEQVKDEQKPEFILEGVKLNDFLNWNKEFDSLKGIKAIDNIDGDITDRIEVEGIVDNQTYGFYKLIYKVSDNAGNEATIERTIEVVWNYDVTFIGHAGSYYGLMNSEEAILYALEVLKYQAVEVDLKQTSDGVFVLSHDNTFGDYEIAKTTWNVLKDVTVTKSRKAGFPAQNGSVTKDTYTTGLCTLERYLELCKKYNAKAVIELKSSAGITNSDQSRMKAFMEEVEKAGMREDVILLGSQYNCLIWTRQNGYSDVECQYLVNSCESDSVLERCKQYDLDVSINVTANYSNSDEWLAKYKDAGLKISTYTYTQYVDYKDVQTWIDKGVDYVTCDWHIMSKLTLPESSNDPSSNVTHNVVFKDYDGTVLKETVVKDGRTAASPTNPSRPGYLFIGWDKEITNVHEDLVVQAVYEIIEYTITYDKNLTKIVKSKWLNKQDFVDEFYKDFYNWFITNGNRYPSFITIEGSKVTIVKNGETISFASDTELKAINISKFELTASNFIYKPVTRDASGKAQIDASEDYFLNSNLYREKYIALDDYFYAAALNGYPAYDRTYTPLASGKIQIFFRFHQWATTQTAIPAFDKLPDKYILKENTDITVTLPSSHLTYNVNDEFDLPLASGSVSFLGWFLDKECTRRLEKLEKGTTGNIILYAKWDYTIPVVKSKITFELNGGTLSSGTLFEEYEEGKELILPILTKEGFTFLGWVTEEGSTSYISVLPEDQTGDVTLYACFKENKTLVEEITVGPNEAYKTISDALKDATDNTKIYIKAGTYEENITITKNGIKLIGPNNLVLGTSEKRTLEAIIKGTITISENVTDIHILGLSMLATTVVNGISNNENIYIQYNVIEGTASTAGTSSKGIAQVYFGGNVTNLIVEYNKFTLHSDKNYYSCVYAQGLVTNAELNDNYVTNSCTTSRNVFAFWLRNAAGLININNNQAIRFAGNYWTFWVGQDKLAEETKINMCDNTLDSLSSTDAACGIAVHHAEYSSIVINYIGNTFNFVKDTIFSVQGASTADTTSTPHVTIMYNKILNTSARMRFCFKADNFYFGKNYSALPYTDQGTPNIKANDVAKDDFSSTMELDDAYLESQMITINYELDGGTLSDDAPLKYLPGFATRLGTAVREGYKFLGWTTSADSTDYIMILPATTVGNITLYAKFKEIKPSLEVGEDKEYKDLASALEAAVDGDTIELFPGTYKGATITKSVTIIGPNANINPNKDQREAEAMINTDLIIEASNVEINGIGLTGAARIVGAPSISIENIAISYVHVSATTVNGKDTAAYHFVPTAGVKYKNISIKYSRTEKGTGRQMAFYGYDIENLEIVGNEFYGASSTYNDGIKIDGAGSFGVKGDINISDNVLDGYQQYTIWFIKFGCGIYTIENNIIKNVGIADYHTATRFDTYVGLASDPLKISFSFNTLTNGYMLMRFEAKTQNANNAVINVNYNIRKDCKESLYIKNSNESVIVNAEHNYFGVATPDPEKFLNVATYANYYETAEDVPTRDEVVEDPSVIKIYSKINYELDGGEVNGSTRYLEGDGYVLPIPKREDYIFLGWTLEFGSTNYITEISKTTKGDVTVYANWEKIVYYNVTYMLNGGYSGRALFEARTNEPTLTINNYNYNGGTFWSGAYATDIFISDSNNDPKAAFSDRIYIAKNKDTNLYEIVEFVSTGGFSWPDSAEYAIIISNSYGGYGANIKPITRNLKVGMVVAFGGNITDISHDNPTKVCFFEELPKVEKVTEKVGTDSSLLVPGLLGYRFLGWYDEANKQITSISEITKDITLYAKWEAVNPATGIKIDAFPEELRTGEKFQIIASIEPTDAYFTTVYYSSSNTDIIEVSKTGELVAKNAGTATITMRDYMSIVVVEKEITVYPVDSIDVSFETVYQGTLSPNETIQLLAVAFGKNANGVTFTYKSTNEEIATISSTGLITALKDGYVDIVITAVGMDANLTVGITVKTKEDEATIDKLLSLLLENTYGVISKGNVSLYNDGTKKVYVPTYGSVNNYLFDKFEINEQYYATTENNPNNHKARRAEDTIQFVTIHDTATLTGTVESIASGMSSGETSIHYTVGNDAIFGVVPEKYIAYHAGDGTGSIFTWTKTAATATENVAPAFDVTRVGDKYYLVVNDTTTTIEIPKTGSKTPSKELLNHLGPVWKVEGGYYYIGGPLWYSDYGTISTRGGNTNSIGIEMCVNTSGDVYDTWQRTAMLVVDILIRNNLDTTRVKQHNTWSGKNCPQSILEGSLWPTFMEMVNLQYEIMTKYKDAKISIVSDNLDIIDNTGRVVNAPMKTTTVTYTLKVELNGETREVKLSAVVPGTTTWEMWDGTYPASRVWNNHVYAY